jgi:hypothetical protein
MAVTYQDICLDALREIGVLTGSDPAESDMADQALNKLIRIRDLWNADRECIYDESFPTYAITPGLTSHWIGPAASIPAPQWSTALENRPVSIEGANLVLSTGATGVRTPLRMVDDAEWMNIRMREVPSPMPIYLLYHADWPLGEVKLWPVPTVAYAVELWIRQVLAEPTLATTFSMPPGYREAMTLTLAESLAGPMMVPLPQMLPQSAARARAIIKANNTDAPKLTTQDSGMPSNGRRGTKMNFLTREIL